MCLRLLISKAFFLYMYFVNLYVISSYYGAISFVQVVLLHRIYFCSIFGVANNGILSKQLNHCWETSSVEHIICVVVTP